jgi:hypothetical protein
VLQQGFDPCKGLEKSQQGIRTHLFYAPSSLYGIGIQDVSYTFLEGTLINSSPPLHTAAKITWLTNEPIWVD